MNRFQVKKVAVLGAGVMGAQIAAHLVNVKVPVVLFDLPAKEGAKNGIVTRAVEGLNALRMNDPERLGDWFGQFMTVYRSVDGSRALTPPRSRIEVEFDLQQGALLQRHPWTRCAWRRDGTRKTRARLYVAGQAFALPLADARALAAADTLDAGAYAALGDDAQALVLELLAQGHFQLALPDDDEEDCEEDAPPPSGTRG